MKQIAKILILALMINMAGSSVYCSESMGRLSCVDYNTIFFEAIKKGNRATVLDLLQRKMVDFDTIHGIRDDALQLAVNHGQIEIVKILLIAGADSTIIYFPSWQYASVLAVFQASRYGDNLNVAQPYYLHILNAYNTLRKGRPERFKQLLGCSSFPADAFMSMQRQDSLALYSSYTMRVHSLLGVSIFELEKIFNQKYLAQLMCYVHNKKIVDTSQEAEELLKVSKVYSLNFAEDAALITGRLPGSCFAGLSNELP